MSEDHGMSRSAVETGYEGRRWVILATVAVLLWRATALLWPSSLVSIPDSVRLPITLLGVLYLGILPSEGIELSLRSVSNLVVGR